MITALKQRSSPKPGTARFDRATIDEVLARTDIGSLIGACAQLRKRGADLVGLCPFHVEKTPSFHVHPDRGFFKCFGCGAAGDVIEFERRRSGCSFVEAVERLADRSVVQIRSLPKREHFRAVRPAPANDVRAALSREMARYREAHGIADCERLLTFELNRIRERVSALLDVQLRPLQRVAADSACAGRERDELWPALLERAWFEAWTLTTGRPALYGVDEFARLGRAGIAALEVAERRAADDVRAIVAAELRAARTQRVA